MVSWKIWGAFLSAVFALAMVPAVRAEVVMSNVSSTTSAAIYLGEGGYFSFQAAQARLNSLSFVLAPGSSAPTAPLTVSIYSYQEFFNASGAKTKLITLSPTDQEPFSATNQTLTYIPLSEFLFAANTDYVVGIESADTSSYNLPFADDLPVSASGWSYNPSNSGIVTGGPDGISWGPSIPFQIDATAVPEPAAWSLVGVGVLGGFVVLRRRKTAACA